MRCLLLALPFALLPLTHAQAAEPAPEHAEHASLSAHAHGAAQLNAVLDGQTLELQLESPAMNLVGFEYLAKTATNQATVAAVRAELENPLSLFGLPAAASCTLRKHELESPLFGTTSSHEQHPAAGQDAMPEERHSEIHAHYQFECSTPAALKTLDLGPLFERFPTTQKIQVQLISPNGQQGLELTPRNSRLNF